MLYRKITIEQRKLLSKINKLKLNLRATDYQAIKFAEGQMTATEYAPIKEKRIAWRKEINELQAQLEALQTTETEGESD